MNVNLIFIRHGESIANADNQVYYRIPDNQIPLSSTGINQANALGIKLEEDYGRVPFKIIHSPWERAKQTATLISNNISYSEIIEDPLIYEISLMHSFNEMKTEIDFFDESKKEYGFYWYKEGTSESYADVYQRARIFVQDLKLNKYNFNNEDNIIIVSHGIFINMVLGVLKNQSTSQIFDTKWLRNCETSHVTMTVFDAT